MAKPLAGTARHIRADGATVQLYRCGEYSGSTVKEASQGHVFHLGAR